MISQNLKNYIEQRDQRMKHEPSDIAKAIAKTNSFNLPSPEQNMTEEEFEAFKSDLEEKDNA